VTLAAASGHGHQPSDGVRRIRNRSTNIPPNKEASDAKFTLRIGGNVATSDGVPPIGPLLRIRAGGRIDSQ
jgi:hypothetical protein